MTATNTANTTDDKNEIFYGSRGIDVKNIVYLTCLLISGAWLAAYSTHAHSQQGLIGGVLAMLMALAGFFFLLKNQVTNTPCITINENGIRYLSNSTTTFEAQWDSVDQFTALKNKSNRTLFLNAPIIGSNVSENLRGEKNFRISLLSTLDAPPERLLEDLNRTREKALRQS